MTTKDKTALIVDGLTRICADVAALAAVLEDDVPQDAPVAEPAPAPEKVYWYEPDSRPAALFIGNLAE